MYLIAANYFEKWAGALSVLLFALIVRCILRLAEQTEGSLAPLKYANLTKEFIWLLIKWSFRISISEWQRRYRQIVLKNHSWSFLFLHQNICTEATFFRQIGIPPLNHQIHKKKQIFYFIEFCKIANKRWVSRFGQVVAVLENDSPKPDLLFETCICSKPHIDAYILNAKFVKTIPRWR